MHRVQASWAAVEPGLSDHALAMTHAFVGHAPTVLELVHGKRGQALTDPEMGAVMVAHQATLLRMIGAIVAGSKDVDALAPTLVRCGRMHARFGDGIRAFFPACGAAMMDALRGALGEEAFTDDVAAAWRSTFDAVAAHMIQGIDSVATATAAEESLRDMLLSAAGAAPSASQPATVTVA